MATEYRELNAVIKAIWSVKISPDAEIFNALKRAIEEEVKNIEPANVRPVVRGKWTRVDYEPCGHDYICSECGCKSDGAWNFCHDCGADMRKSVEIEQVKEGAE